MRSWIWTLALAGACTGEVAKDDDTDVATDDSEAVGDTDAGGDTDVDTDAGDDTDTIPEPTCDDPGTPTTPIPVAPDDDAAMNVEALACTRTATALACELGTEHAYSETISGGFRNITANGIVDHDVGAFPNPGNPNTIAPQTYAYKVPLTPSGEGTSRQGVMGILFSGAVLDPGTAETWNDDPTWRYEALRYATAPDYFDANGGTDETFHPDALGVDCNLAHVQPGGVYHYHGLPTSLVPASPQVRQVGWAADGYPILVLYGHEDGTDPSSAVRAMHSSYRLKAGTRPSGSPGGAYDGTFGNDWRYEAGLGDLDACNGRVETVVIDGTPTETYAYFLTDTFPFVPRCFQATPDSSFDRATGGGGGGGGTLPTCQPGQTSMCCGGEVCDGPETATNCPADCP